MNHEDSPPPRLPWPLRLVNALPAALVRPTLDADALWSAASRSSGPDGGLDSSANALAPAREALGVLIDEAQRAPLSTVGRLALRAELEVALDQLHRVRAAVPSPEPEVAPLVVVVGLPRTGTTLLHRLLSLHRAARWPRNWELLRPWPAPHHAPDALTDDDRRRIALARTQVEQAHRVMPGLRQIHTLDAEGPDECHALLAQTACCASWDAQLPAPGYTAWLLRQDLRWTYTHHRRALALLQRHASGAFWALKTPLHLFGLAALRATYPDARLIVTHRAPSRVAASCCSLYEHARSVYVRAVDPTSLGAPWLDVWGQATDRAAEALSRWPASQLVHVDYDRLVADPAGTVTGALSALALPEDPGLPDAIAAWSLEDAAERRAAGEHRYRLDRYGLRPEQVDERFAAWRAFRPS